MIRLREAAARPRAGGATPHRRTAQRVRASARVRAGRRTSERLDGGGVADAEAPHRPIKRLKQGVTHHAAGANLERQRLVRLLRVW